MEIVDYTVKAKEVELIPFCCVHWDHPNSDHELFKELLQQAREHGSLLVGLGDYRDFARTHFRSFLKSYRDDDSSMEFIDHKVREEVEEFAALFDGIEKQVIGLGEGNHAWTFMDGTTDTQYLCQLLGVPYLGDASFIRLYIQQSTETHCIIILTNHGISSGGGRYIASDVGAMERYVAPNFDADIYLSGHTHKKWAVKVPVLGISARGEGRLVEKTKVLAKTGAFLKGYVCGKKSYIEKPLFGPSELGWITFTINPFIKADKRIMFTY